MWKDRCNIASTESNALSFENVYVYSRTLNQPKHVYLQELFSHVLEITYFAKSDKDQDLISTAEVRPNSIFIFDEVGRNNEQLIRIFKVLVVKHKFIVFICVKPTLQFLSNFYEIMQTLSFFLSRMG